jgi:hypothetical protein
MKCPKCRYSSFPHLEKCPKCGSGLAEQRTAMGIYALPPDPPDLLQAFQAASMDVMGERPIHPLAAPDIDLGRLEGIDMEIAEIEPHRVGTPEMGEPTDPATDAMPAQDREAFAEEEFPPGEPSGERLSSQEMIIPQSRDLGGLGDITLAIESEVELGGESSESAQMPAESAEVTPVYDLDLDEELEGLTLESIVDEARADEADGDEAAEYTLEIEEDLEFEVDSLELEQDEEDADDGDR